MKSHFQFNKNERSGIFFLILIITILGLISWFVDFSSNEPITASEEVNRLNQQIDSLAKLTPPKKRYTYNPNYIDQDKGYQIGLSLDEINRLLQYRLEGNYVNSAKEFQQVTLVSDAVLEAIKQDFRFPDFKNTKKKSTSVSKKSKVPIVVKDMNAVSEEELKQISGIGDVLAARIIKFRTALGGFLIEDQLYDVYGLKPEIVNKLKERYAVLTKPTIEKLNINEVSAYDLSSLTYINYPLAKQIIAYRDSVGGFQSIDELTKIQGFPVKKINRIGLYLLIN
ncbi:helix-hairpin-helix domain-containing protein [Spongiivirga sp. MCCC 1A20706]|uniref:ComEA family DNA-binding protein n=1 Tax=Spongiivirga sp. MCCC 1A20706 TaxID=3160963 RepID=UPI00397773D2